MVNSIEVAAYLFIFLVEHRDEKYEDRSDATL